MATNHRKDKIIYELKNCCKLDEPTACSIYDKADKLFHNILTLTDFSILLTYDEHVLSGLVLLLIDSISGDNPNKVYAEIIIYIILNYEKGFGPKYVFFQLIGFFCGQPNIVQGLKTLTTVLNQFYNYLDKSGTKSFNSTGDLFDTLNNTLRVLEEDVEEIVKHNQQEEIKNIRQKLDEYLNKYHITLSNDGDDDDE